MDKPKRSLIRSAHWEEDRYTDRLTRAGFGGMIAAIDAIIDDKYADVPVRFTDVAIRVFTWDTPRGIPGESYGEHLFAIIREDVIVSVYFRSKNADCSFRAFRVQKVVW